MSLDVDSQISPGGQKITLLRVAALVLNGQYGILATPLTDISCLLPACKRWPSFFVSLKTYTPDLCVPSLKEASNFPLISFMEKLFYHEPVSQSSNVSFLAISDEYFIEWERTG